jgi:RNA polymerase sigma-70 factor, ECF subfamily
MISTSAPAVRAEPYGCFERDVLPHLPMVYSAARCLTGNRGDAEVLVQETFAIAYASRQHRPERRLEVWLYRILADARRRRRQVTGPGQAEDGERRRGDLAALTGLGGSDVTALQRLTCLQVRRALQQLPEDVRFTVWLADVEALSCQDIARITGTQPATVRARLRSGRRELTARLMCCVPDGRARRTRGQSVRGRWTAP